MSPETLDEALAALVPDAPWTARSPSPWPRPPPTGNAAVDGALARLDAAPDIANGAATELLAAPSPALVDALWSMLLRLEGEPAPAPCDQALLATLPTPELKARAIALTNAANASRLARQGAVLRVLAVLEGMSSPELRRRLAERLEQPGPKAFRKLLASSLLGYRCYALPGSPAALMMRDHGRRREPSAIAERALLEQLTAHLRPGDPLAGVAAEAVWIQDPASALARISGYVESVPPDARAAAEAEIFARFFDGAGATSLSLDHEPGWVRLFGRLLGSATPLEQLGLLYVLISCSTSAPILEGLRHAEGEAVFSDLLGALRRVDDPAAAAPLEALAATLRSRACGGKRSPRSREAVLALVKRLRRKREVAPARASFEFCAAVGTEGGPIVVLPAELAPLWEGARATYGTAEHVPGDYDQACAAAGDAEFAAFEWRGARALVVAAPHVSCARVKGGLWLVTHGSELETEIAAKERRGRKKWRRRLDVGDRGLVVLDAATTLAAAVEGASAQIEIPAGAYAIEAQSTDVGSAEVSILRLAPA